MLLCALISAAAAVLFPLCVRGITEAMLGGGDVSVGGGLAQLLLDAADGAHGKNVVLLGHIRGQVLLGGEENQLVAAHRGIQRRDGGRPLHIEGQQHPRKYVQAPQGEQRQLIHFFDCCSHDIGSFQDRKTSPGPAWHTPSALPAGQKQPSC